MTLHLRHVLKCSLECGGGGGGLDTGHGDNVSGGGRHTGPALCSQQPASLVTGPIGCCCSAGPGWCGCHGSLVRANHLPGPGAAAVTLSRGVTWCHAPTSPRHQAEAELASGRQLQLASFSATFGWITRADKTSPPASSLSCGELIFDIN